LELNAIYQGDAFELLKAMPDRSVDLLLTDPPYGVLGMQWDKAVIDWEMLAEEAYRVLKVNGCIYIFGQFPMICDVYNSFSKRFKFKQDLVWYKNRGFSLATTVYTKYHENILFFVKGNESIVGQLAEEVKQKRAEKGWSVKQAQRAFQALMPEFKYYEAGGGGWLWFETGRCPTLAEYEVLIRLLSISDSYRMLFDRPTFNFEEIKLKGEPYKLNRKRPKLYGQESNLAESYQVVNDGKRNPKTVLEYSIVNGGKEYLGHPTQKPVELLKYLITASTMQGDVILDPFVGSGSTTDAANQLGRQYVGFELAQEYVEMARSRIKQKSLLQVEAK
jgi:DNA modification methylase